MANYQNMKIEDLYRLRDNKVNYGNTNNQTYKDVYSLNNKNIRAAYGMTDADDVSLNQLDQYIAAAEKQQATDNQKNGLLTNLTQKAMNGDVQVQKSADAVKNFNYNPSTDPAYQSYVDMYNRQGQSAAKSTLNNLNSANMGRNSSYSAATTAQVQQAYAQKASEMIPTLAEQAYNRLLQRYSIDKDMSDTQFNRELTAYQTVADAATRELTDEQLRDQNQHNKWSYEQDYKYGPTEREQGIKMNDLNLRDTENTVNLNEKYTEKERQLGIQGAEADIANVYSTINKRSMSGSSGGSNSYSKQGNMANADRTISQWLYSPYDMSGTKEWKTGYFDATPQYIAVEKMKDPTIANNVIDTLIASGYTYAQAVNKLDEYKTNITIETMKIEGKDGWNDPDVVKERKSVIFG